MTSNTAQILTIIPARMGSHRLPGKPLADMAGLPMIVRVWQQAVKADLGPVIVACAEDEIKTVIEAAGGEAILTDPQLPSGSDRVWAAAQVYDPAGAFDIILNLQGDMPLIDPDILRATVQVLRAQARADIATAVTGLKSEAERRSPHIVKAILAPDSRALNFSRKSAGAQEKPPQERDLFHHVGLYAYRRAALSQFCSLPPSARELDERLEQLRALDNDMIIYAAHIDHAPAGIDTKEDFAQANAVLKAEKAKNFDEKPQ